ncbi:MAG: sigma-70 family RNA polymerase sigma factor [Patescibacteria group bacterium]
MSEFEKQIFANANQDYDAAFAKLFGAYCHDVFRVAVAASYYSVDPAIDLTREVFAEAYKYIHAFSPQQGSFHLHLMMVLVKVLRKRSTPVPSTHEIIPKYLKHRLRPDAARLWYAIQHLPFDLWLVCELFYGGHFTPPEIAYILNQPVSQIQTLLGQVHHYLRQVTPTYHEHLIKIYKRRNRFAVLKPNQQVRLMRLLLERKRMRMTFIQRSVWQRLARPRNILILAITGGLIGAMIVALLYREPARQLFTQNNLPTTNQVSSLFTSVVTDRRPSFLYKSGDLPKVEVVRESLVTVTEKLYGTKYVSDQTQPTDADGLTPQFSFAFAEDKYIQVSTAYTYMVPEKLSEDTLQYAALKHFVSLPLNQFTYVNGTYYIPEDPTQFRPLFISFNNNGAIDYQMRQVAICDLPNLTEPIADTQAQSFGYEFLKAHKFIEADEADLEIERMSSENRTVPLDAFCKNGDTKPVQDRLLVYFTPQTSLKFGTAANDQLPLRLPGVAVQLHGKHITNLRVDPLFLLLQSAVRGSDVTLKPLSQAMTELQKYHYPNEAELGEAQRHATVFPQWNHSHGSDRFTQMAVSTVALEYVYDELNHTIEPYYIFTGMGTDGNGKTISARWYVTASTTDVELRGPYRE